MFLLLQLINVAKAQVISAGFPVLEEKLRRDQLLGIDIQNSFLLRPIIYDSLISNQKKFQFQATPALLLLGQNSNRPALYNPYTLPPSAGLSSYGTAGFYLKAGFLRLQIQPEIAFYQNKTFQGTPQNWDDKLMTQRYWDWIYGDFPETFGNERKAKLWWGQSKLTAQFGAFEIGASSQNIWWGPGQWNSLLFSNNAPGFPHLTLNTYRPAKSFLGNFEMQLLIGRLESSNLPPLANSTINSKFFKPLSTDWRYLNAVFLSYNPKWIPNLFLGFGRTFQVYNNSKGSSFGDWLPVFEAFQKERFFNNGNSVEFDTNDRDQQVAIFARYKVIPAKAEIYFEYGRRDHAFNWREFTLNPEHARAYLLGLNKLFSINNRLFQIKGEMTNQQESVNRYIRYPGLTGYHSWHMHDSQRGFTNFGQPIGVGLGPGSNIQTFEVAMVDNFNKMGILLSRMENNQGFYYRAFGQQNEVKPWVDLSVGLLFDKQFDNLLFSSKVQLVNGRNYQWQLGESSTSTFPKGQNLISFHGQLSLIYLWNKKF